MYERSSVSSPFKRSTVCSDGVHVSYLRDQSAKSGTCEIIADREPSIKLSGVEFDPAPMHWKWIESRLVESDGHLILWGSPLIGAASKTHRRGHLKQSSAPPTGPLVCPSNKGALHVVRCSAEV